MSLELLYSKEYHEGIRTPNKKISVLENFIKDLIDQLLSLQGDAALRNFSIHFIQRDDISKETIIYCEIGDSQIKDVHISNSGIVVHKSSKVYNNNISSSTTTVYASFLNITISDSYLPCLQKIYLYYLAITEKTI